jgi:hypothetical protein
MLSAFTSNVQLPYCQTVSKQLNVCGEGRSQIAKHFDSGVHFRLGISSPSSTVQQGEAGYKERGTA